MNSLSPPIKNIQNNIQIIEIFNKNELADLKKFMTDREHLNYYNSYLIYLFHIIQTSGVLLTSISASSDNVKLLWIGIIFNMLAQLILIFEKINDSKLKKQLIDIQSIKNGTYVDESSLIDVDKDINHNNDSLPMTKVSNNSGTSDKQSYNTYQSNNNDIKSPLLNNNI